MADFKVKGLANHDIPGSDLFDDFEDFMIELTDQDESNIFGGMCCPATFRECDEYYTRKHPCTPYTNDGIH